MAVVATFPAAAKPSVGNRNHAVHVRDCLNVSFECCTGAAYSKDSYTYTIHAHEDKSYLQLD